jgi:hypothetical protein
MAAVRMAKDWAVPELTGVLVGIKLQLAIQTANNRQLTDRYRDFNIADSV